MILQGTSKILTQSPWSSEVLFESRVTWFWEWCVMVYGFDQREHQNQNIQKNLNPVWSSAQFVRCWKSTNWGNMTKQHAGRPSSVEGRLIGRMEGVGNLVVWWRSLGSHCGVFQPYVISTSSKASSHMKKTHIVEWWGRIVEKCQSAKGIPKANGTALNGNFPSKKFGDPR